MTLAEFHSSCRALDGGTDKGLANYITVTESMRQLADYNSQASIAVGLKGIGKSSSFRYLTEINKDADVIIPINPDKFTLQLPQKDLSVTTCRKQFEHDLIFEALRGVISYSQNKSSARIDKALIGDAKRAVGYYINLLRSVIRNLELDISILGIGFTLRSGTVATAAGLTREDEIDFARRTLANICASGVKIRIVVDDPEEVFSVNKALDVEMIGGFCLAALRLSAYTRNFKIIALLKTHVYHPINSKIEDLSKYPDHFAILAWSQDELDELISNRLRAAHMGWNDLLSTSPHNEITRFLTRKIRNGPRDLLRWLDLALKESQDTPVSMNQVHATYEKMSQNSFEEFSRAYSASYEGLSQLTRIIFAKKTQTMFAPKEFKDYLLRLLVRNQEVKGLQTHQWFQKIHASILPQILFNAGIISFKIRNKVILPYEAGYTRRNFDQATSIFLTPGFIPAMA